MMKKKLFNEMAECNGEREVDCDGIIKLRSKKK
jgi:hypothetical protein